MTNLTKLFVSLFAMTAVMASTAQAFDDPNAPAEREVVIGVNDAFVPGGFDSQSDVYVVVNGLFPNGCYRWTRSEVTPGSETDTLEVRSIATVSQGMCIMVMVPFTREVPLGVLGAGEHRVRFMNGDGTFLEKKISIEK